MRSDSSSSRSSSSSPPTEYSPQSNPTYALKSLTRSCAPPHGPKKRRGKRISLLREQYAVSPSDEPDAQDQLQFGLVRGSRLSPTSTETRNLAGLELKAALTHDLIRHAWKTLDMLHAPGWHGMDATPIRHHFATMSIESEVVTASLLAVGAMTSRHSAIVGSIRHIDNPSPDDLVALDLGRRREAAAKVLAGRAVQVARDSGVLGMSDDRSGEIASLLRMVTLFTNRDDPFMVELRDNLRFRQASQPARNSLRWITSLIASDAFVGIMHGKRLVVSDRELTGFGLKDVTGAEAEERLRKARADLTPINKEILWDLRHLGMLLMRSVVRIITSPLERDLEQLMAKFDSIYGTLDLLLDLVYRVSDPLEGKSFRYHLLLKMPIILEATLVSQAMRFTKARPDAEGAQDWAESAQCRFLNSLARSSKTLHGSCQPGKAHEGSEGYPKVTADMWNALDVFPEWDELAIEGAIQNGRGWGPLSQTAFGWTELERLHNFLKVSTATFASAYPREQKFRRAWEAHQLEIAKAGVEERLFVRAGGRIEGGLAERMVNQALVELAA